VNDARYRRELRSAATGLALTASLALAAGSGRAPARADTAKDAPPGRRVLLVGLDGADWQAIDPLARAGRLPVLARLRDHGRAGIMLATPPLVSPILWTTIATGRRPEDHRILDFMVDLPSGGQAPVPSSERRVAALWNVFSDAGRRVGVVGWWATWPAEDVAGTVVSDRVAPQLARGDTPIEARSIAPASRTAELAARLVRATDLTREDLSAYLPLTVEEYRAARQALREPSGRLYRNPVAHLSTIVASTRSYARIAEAIVAGGQPELLLVYLEAIDSVSHRFVKDVRGPGAIARAYADVDGVIGRLAGRVAPDTWVLVVSDHGFYAADAGVAEDPSDLEGPATAWHRPYGIVAAAEARVLTGAAGPPPRDAGSVTPLDIAPTVLQAAGLPASREMPGRAVPALVPDDVASRAIPRVATLERPRRALQSPTLAPDESARERLQALGYVGASRTSLGRLNLGEILYRKGDAAGAERELRPVVAEQPSNPAALLWLAKALAAQGRTGAALDVYARVLALPGDAGDALLEAVDLAASKGLPDEARRLLAAAGERARTTPAAAVARAIAARLDGHADLAERELRAALARDATYRPALERLLELLAAEGRAQEALGPLLAAADRAPRSPQLQALLGAALLAAGDAAGAETRLARAADLAPDGVSVRVELARAQLLQGHVDIALATLEAAAVAGSAEAAGLRGAAHARRGEWRPAAEAYELALRAASPTPDLLNALAWARLQLGQRGESTRLLQRSLALQSAQPEIRRLLAQIERGER
jgi:predicted Zn-dependent protease